MMRYCDEAGPAVSIRLPAFVGAEASIGCGRLGRGHKEGAPGHCVRAEDADDAELLRVARSSPGAFAVFYDRYERAVVAYLARRVSDPEVVADLTAEVFAAALGAASRYRPREPTAIAWLLTIAHNTLAKSVRRGRVEARARLRLGIRDSVAFQEDELARVEQLADADSLLLELVEALPAGEREAVRGRVLEERDYSELAETLQTSELVVRKRVSRGLSRLRQQIQKDARQ